MIDNLFENYSKALNSYSEAFYFRPEKLAEMASVPMAAFSENSYLKKMNDMMKGTFNTLPFKFDSLYSKNSEHLSEAVRCSMSYIKLCEKCAKCADAIFEKEFETACKLLRGENAEPKEFLEDLKAACNDMKKCVLDSDIPQIKEAAQAFINAQDSFADDSKKTEEFLQEFMGFSAKLINMSNFSNGKREKVLSDILMKGTVSADTYQSLVSTYGEILKHYAKMLRISVVMTPEYKESTEAIIRLADENIDSLITVLENYFKLYEELKLDANESCQLGKDAFFEKSPDAFFKKIAEATEKIMNTSTRSLAASPDIFQFIPMLTTALKSTKKMYQNVMPFTYATKEELSQVAEELSKALKGFPYAPKKEMDSLSKEVDSLKKSVKAVDGESKSKAQKAA